MLVPTVFDTISAPSAQKSPDFDPFRPNLPVLVDDDGILFRRPWISHQRREKIVLEAVTALARGSIRYELGDVFPILRAEIFNGSPQF
jgi:hypothetical protein